MIINSSWMFRVLFPHVSYSVENVLKRRRTLFVTWMSSNLCHNAKLCHPATRLCYSDWFILLARPALRKHPVSYWASDEKSRIFSRNVVQKSILYRFEYLLQQLKNNCKILLIAEYHTASSGEHDRSFDRPFTHLSSSLSGSESGTYSSQPPYGWFQ